MHCITTFPLITFKIDCPFNKNIKSVINNCLIKKRSHKKSTNTAPKPALPFTSLQHLKVGDKYRCDEENCQFETLYSGNLKLHKLIHKKIRQFKCVEKDCVKSFYTAKDLKRHVNHVHLNWRPLACDWPGCESRFKTNQNLNDHRLTHRNEHQFKCDYNGCQKSYNSRKQLSRHLKQHSAEFSCHWPGCDDRFETNAALTAHLNQHQDIRPFRCEIFGCSHSFYSKPQLSQHLRLVHRFY